MIHSSSVTGLAALAERVISQSVIQHWDFKLKPSPANPFPLAPRDLVRRRLINKHEYDKQVAFWRSFVWQVMRKEISSVTTRMVRSKLGPDFLIGMTWEFGGWGTGRERLAAKFLSQIGFQVVIRDISSVACGYAEDYTCRHGLDWNIERGDVIRAWEHGYVDENRTFAVMASQLVQIFDREQMQRIMHAYGAFVSLPLPRSSPYRRVYLIHPLKSDNSSESVWKEHQLIPEWGDTTPYELGELYQHAQRGAGTAASLRLEVLQKFRHFHQTYSILRLMAH